MNQYMSAKIYFFSYHKTKFGLYHLGHGRSKILWQRATRVIVGWLAGRTWKNIGKSHT
jgi:hypothetical protein